MNEVTTIAANLALSYRAVAHVCSRLKPKLGVRSLPELVRFAIENLPATPIRNGRRETFARLQGNE